MTKNSSLLDQSRAVWAVAFACVVAFMGIGLVDPVLPTLASELHASPSDVSLLFTSYFAMTGVSMLVTGWASSRIGPRRTLLVGLALVVTFSALAGAAGSVFQIAGFRLGWGLGNALFIATALSVIVGAASGGLTSAIILYEAALGLGIASGPLLDNPAHHRQPLLRAERRVSVNLHPVPSFGRTEWLEHLSASKEARMNNVVRNYT
jgi:ACDE family multidrug resistance protein